MNILPTKSCEVDSTNDNKYEYWVLKEKPAILGKGITTFARAGIGSILGQLMNIL